MIVLYTDFGWQGPYVGQMKAVLHRHAPNVPVVDLMHDVPCFNPAAGAYLLASLIAPFAEGSVFLCVVDPGVGDPQRVPVALHADARWYVGPANGLLDVVAARSRRVQAYRIEWRPRQLSNSFHGRDLFAVVAADLALSNTEKLAPLVDTAPLFNNPPASLNEIIYIDAYGNCITGMPGENCASSARLILGEQSIEYARTFSAVAPGTAFWYINALGLIEIAVSQGDAAGKLRVHVGDTVMIQE